MELLVLLGFETDGQPSTKGFGSKRDEHAAQILGAITGKNISPDRLQSELTMYQLSQGQAPTGTLDERTMTTLNEVARDKNFEAALSGNLSVMGADAGTKNALVQVNAAGKEVVSAIVDQERLQDELSQSQQKQKASIDQIHHQIELLRASGRNAENRISALISRIASDPNIPADVKGSLTATLKDMDDECDIESPKKGGRRSQIASRIAGRKAGAAMHEAIHNFRESLPDLKEKFGSLADMHEVGHVIGAPATTPSIPGGIRGGRDPFG